MHLTPRPGSRRPCPTGIPSAQRPGGICPTTKMPQSLIVHNVTDRKFSNTMGAEGPAPSGMTVAQLPQAPSSV